MHCSGHAGNDRADTLAGKKQQPYIPSGLRLGRSEMLRSLRHYLQAQNQGCYTVDHLEETGVERGSVRRERAIIREKAKPSNIVWTVSTGTFGKLTNKVERIIMGFSKRMGIILN